jgi:hypothetical protein
MWTFFAAVLDPVAPRALEVHSWNLYENKNVGVGLGYVDSFVDSF